MDRDEYIAKLLNDFIFLDRRLEDHPKVDAMVFWMDGESLVLIESTSSSLAKIPKGIRLRPGEGVTGHVFASKKYFNVTDIEPWPYQAPSIRSLVKPVGYKSMLGIPLLDGKNAVGVLSFESVQKDFFHEKHLGLAQLLAALLVYTKLYSVPRVTPSSVALGNALRMVREEIGLTQAELAEKIGRGRIAVSRWESGSQPPTKGPLREWCEALELFSSTMSTHVAFVDITPKLIKLIREDPVHLRDLLPDQFEQFIAGRLKEGGQVYSRRFALG